MKKSNLSHVFLLVLVVILSACKDKIYRKYIANVPIYMDYESFRASVKMEGPRAIKEQGNIYKKDHYLLIVEPNQGVHFINNANPSSPVKTGFLNVIGCTGMSMKDQYLYVNSYTDMVIVDVSSWSQPKEVARLKDIFPQVLPAYNEQYPIAKIDKEKGIVIGWEIKETKEEVENQPTWNNCPTCEMTTFGGTSGPSIANGSGSSSGTGISGSITKFSIINNHLYVMENHNLHAINVSNPLTPETTSKIQIWREVETLFPHGNHLFMGTTTGMLIFSVASPSNPTQVSEVNHMTACDPVVVQDNYAYVTVRSGRSCGGEINQLDVIDISNLAQPSLKKSFAMNNPHGLGIDGNLLFICDGTAGLKVFNASNPLTVGDQLVKQFQQIQATDIIPHNQVAIMIGSDGLYQYDYSNPSNIQLLSKIPF